MSANPQSSWRVNRALALHAYNQAKTTNRDFEKCPTECDLIPVIYRDPPHPGFLVLGGVGILILALGLVGSFIGVWLAGVFP